MNPIFLGKSYQQDDAFIMDRLPLENVSVALGGWQFAIRLAYLLFLWWRGKVDALVFLSEDWERERAGKSGNL